MFIRQPLRVLPQQLDIRALNPGPPHHPGGVLIPHGPEHRRSYWPHFEPVIETPQIEPFPLEPLANRFRIDFLALLVLHDEHGHALVRRALLRERREPREDQLRGFLRQGGEVDVNFGGGEGDIDRQEVAAVIEAVGFKIRYVRVDDRDAGESGAFVEDLHADDGRDFAHPRIDNGAWLDAVPAEAEGDFGAHVEMWQDVGHDVHLGDALVLDFASVGAPLLVCQVAVYRPVHFHCGASERACR